LFFSSDSLPGYGGYDIFTCKFSGESWGKPVNLSKSVNSENDDIAFTINKMDGRTAFFTRRKAGINEMQLFRITLNQDEGYRNLLSISYIFNGKPFTTPSSLPVSKAAEAKVSETKIIPEKVSEKEVVKSAELPSNLQQDNADTKKSAVAIPDKQKDVVIYRIQLLPSQSQINSKEMVINGKSYKLYEYIYLSTTRYTIGEFSTVSAAVLLQNICRQSGYPQSFVVAFRNNVRSLDPDLFK
jgi:hypothetical protein